MLRNIKNLPEPKAPNDIRQMLAMTGYYHKTFPCLCRLSTTTNTTDPQSYFSDMDRSMPESFWDTEGCAYEELNLGLSSPNKQYPLFADSSKYIWSAVLTQEYTSIIDSKTLKDQHPITYVRGLFQGSQCK